MMHLFDLTGLTAVVTGARRGIGLARAAMNPARSRWDCMSAVADRDSGTATAVPSS